MTATDPYVCGYPRCSRRSCVTLIDVPLCADHWQERCEADGEDSSVKFLNKIGLSHDMERGTVRKDEI